ncbi:hypothetical protein M514_08093 [Trichuris suis]|uniref:Protein root UVB sensitive/RUS domain-containing protein n=1 Tax=Trichuris suis TaxID=68888 RepID=A0A085M1F6_9BILA|nr:hypothetical protein M513_08093 [Trichuris suis]KFD73266.1 hypothetical protein M514_08093 [Trichuris suis]KHJ45507.1 hypothetical protein D918_04244 [Trichuris suis]
MSSQRFLGTLRVTEYYRSKRHSAFDIQHHGHGTLLGMERPPTLYQRFILFLYTAFLPVGYPASVTKDYWNYQVWDSFQAFCSSVTGALGMHAVLRGVGVGDEKASVLAASLTWLLRDGSGMIAQIFVAWLAGRHLDTDCKAWRLTADVFNDLATWLELMSPDYEPFFLAIVCMSSILRAIVGLAGTASRTAITQHQALSNNLADVSAKDAAQETLVNFVALLWNLVMLPLVSKRRNVVIALCAIFTMLHIQCNYKAIRSLRFRTLNEKRFSLIVRSYLATGHVPGIAEVNLEESLWPSLFTRPFNGRMSLGASMSAVLDKKPNWFYATDSFILRCSSRRGTKPHVDVLLAIDCSIHDILEAAFYAEAFLNGQGKNRLISSNGEMDHLYLFYDNVDFHQFYMTLQSSHWVVNEHSFIVHDYRYSAIPMTDCPYASDDEYANGSLF